MVDAQSPPVPEAGVLLDSPEMLDGPGALSGVPDSVPVDPAARIAELEALLRVADTELADLRSQVASATADLRLGAAKYREAVLASAPDIPPELVAGDTVEDIDRSLVAARETVAVVQRRLAERAAAERIPAGAPVRGEPDTSSLSPRDKIALALSRG